MTTLDTRTIITPVYEALSGLRNQYNKNNTRLKEQKNQAVELYTYLATWGMMRLKAEEKALSQDGKKDVVKKYFQCLAQITSKPNLAQDSGLDTLKTLSSDEYLGLTGLGLAIAQEFGFWATAIYADITGDD
ncbi:MAG: hypothetical protein EA365_13685 [Gloeocapsa sp. DLM2.Bin57]|nr:MAG: hypothetical protein EA365_13685 [Gloeocapsa sp. DLM2.Bin57]